MEIVITGSSGLIGSEAVEYFAGCGYRIYGIDNNVRADFFRSTGRQLLALEPAPRQGQGFHAPRLGYPQSRRGSQFFSNRRVDALLEEGHRTPDQSRRKQVYAEVQQILAHDLPYIDLWYLDNVMVASKRVRNLRLNPSGNFDFLKTAELGNPR